MRLLSLRLDDVGATIAVFCFALPILATPQAQQLKNVSSIAPAGPSLIEVTTPDRYPFAIPCPLATMKSPSLQVIVTQSPDGPALTSAQLGEIPALADQIVFFDGKFDRLQSVIGEGMFVSVKPTEGVEATGSGEGVTWAQMDKCLDAIYDHVKGGKDWGEMKWWIQLKTGRTTVATGGLLHDGSGVKDLQTA